jgi:hypothetical protein
LREGDEEEKQTWFDLGFFLGGNILGEELVQSSQYLLLLFDAKEDLILSKNYLCNKDTVVQQACDLGLFVCVMFVIE